MADLPKKLPNQRKLISRKLISLRFGVLVYFGKFDIFSHVLTVGLVDFADCSGVSIIGLNM